MTPMIVVDVVTPKHYTPPLVVWVSFLLLFGAASVIGGILGWRNAERIAPTSLPETLYHRRTRVLRRGSAGFFVVGVVLMVTAIYYAAAG